MFCNTSSPTEIYTYGHALSLHDALPIYCDGASGHRAGGELQAAASRPDAVFAANDMMALGCLFALNHAGIQAPRDIAIAGFDDIPLARYVHPSLTTMRVDIAEPGGRALRALLECAAQPPGPGGGKTGRAAGQERVCQ